MGRWDINPFTGQFEIVDSCKSSGGGANGVTLPFVIGDWTLSAGLYQLDLQHNLESEDVTVTLYEGANEVETHRTEIINTNTVRIYASADPDCRFNGKAIILSA